MRLAALALAAAAVLAAQAHGATAPQALLARHAPILVLHAAERFGPVAVDGFLADSDLLQRAADGTWQPLAGPLPAGAPLARLDQRLCRAVDGPAALDCYAQAQAAHGTAPVVYGAVFRSATRVALQYWLFYPFNLWSQTAAAGTVWQAHEGDWEAVTVLLDAKEKPLLVGASRHCAGIRRDWARVPKRGRRPLIQVSLGSHANGFAAGTIAQDPACWPKEAVAVLDAYKAKPVDVAGGGRTLVPRLLPVTAAAPPWMRFAGTWGEDRYVSFPANPPLAFGAGPRGPVPHALWRRPFAEPLRWTPSG